MKKKQYIVPSTGSGPIKIDLGIVLLKQKGGWNLKDIGREQKSKYPNVILPSIALPAVKKSPENVA